MAVIDRSKGKSASQAKKLATLQGKPNKLTYGSPVHISQELIDYWQEQEIEVKRARMARVHKGAGSHNLFGSDRHFYREKDISYHD